MPVTLLETKLDVNDDKLGDRNAEVHLGPRGAVPKSPPVPEADPSAAVLRREGIDFRQETLKFETEDGNAVVAGPSVGAEAGLKQTANGGNFVAKADLSLVRAEKSLQVAEDLDVYASANLNANTGLEVGADGVEVNFLGLGVTAGVGGKWKVNTPFGSIGFAKPKGKE